ncbi:FAD binding domain-containing protein [Prauserella alba]|uniref:Xanthine dehydrogenase family protein subunit M n=1 Tax=Prauserella alba TaxID=176898 RepID=A0ABN1V2Y3_9PSEU|nr:xanthine dehydrogenase family protein subunit M [Prauserella alba]MCP2180354.1 xanthine dehydrogenase YagS FAD-binding subunit [Prauserella alba]
MRPFELTVPATVDEAVAGGHTFLAGGTTLVDLMKLDVVAPQRVADITALPFHGISTEDGLRIGALERMSDVAAHPGVPAAVTRALLLSASQQLRNMATIGGNLMQRTRCGYFRDITMPCNKRRPGSGCAALEGNNRMHAVLGTSRHCVATHASDLAVALVALDAELRITGPDGGRTVPLTDFYRTPGERPDIENDLGSGDLVTEIVIPYPELAANSTYVKIRDRQSYEFALCSVAAALDVRDGVVAEARIAAGGVGTIPWRLPGVEAALRGEPATEAAFTAAAEIATHGTTPLAHNGFKVPLLKRTLVRALLELTGGDER